MKDTFHLFLKKIAHFQVEYPYLVIALIFTLTLIIYPKTYDVKSVSSLEQMMPKEIEEIKAFNVLRDNYLGQDILGIILEVDMSSTNLEAVHDITDERVYNYILELQKMLNNELDVLQVYSYPIKMQMLGIDTKNISNNLNQLKDYINEERTITPIILTTDISADDDRMNGLAERIKQILNDLGKPPGIKIKLTGTPMIQQKLGMLIKIDRDETQKISTILVFLVTLLIFGTFTFALIPILIVSISVIWLYATMGLINLPISTLAGGVAAMVIGLGIDFAIHIMNKFRFERKRGLSMKKSIEMAVVDTGTALIASSLTTISAFIAFLVGSMPEMARFGKLMAIGISYSLVFSLFGLPALLIIEEKIIYLIKNKLRFGVEKEFKLEKIKTKKKK